jgi:membrane protease YdiL (CAAX protease family)
MKIERRISADVDAASARERWARSGTRETIRSIALPFAFSGIGIAVAFLLKKGLGADLSKVTLSLVALAVTSASVLLLFPGVFKLPFGSVSIREFLANFGLIKPRPFVKLLLLGAFASLFNLSGMLVGSLLTGKYAFSPATITLGQALFSLTPGIWEELLFRGVLMIVLLRLTKSFRRAALIQVLLFGLAHIKGLDFLSLVCEPISVAIIAVGFTYIAYKTKSLIPGMVFHYLHDTFLFAVQLPGGEYAGFRDNLFFYAGLWTSVLLCMAMVKLLAERFRIVSPYDFYAIHGGVGDDPK